MDKPTLLLTRPAASSVKFATRLDTSVTAKADLVISPLMEIVALDEEVEVQSYDGVILTSANGVAHAPLGEGRLAFCVGTQTAAAAHAKRWDVQAVAQDANALVEIILANHHGRFVHLSGTHQRGDIAERLTEKGRETKRVPLYDQRSLPLTNAARIALGGEGMVVLPLFSPRTASYFAAQDVQMGNVHAIAMSDAVAKELDHLHSLNVQILPAPTGAEMVAAVEMLLLGTTVP